MSDVENPRIVYIVSQLGQGGAEQQLYYLLKYLRPNADLISLAEGGYWLQPIRDLGYRVIELKRQRSFDLSRLRAVQQYIQTEQPDIVHLFMDGEPGAYGRIATLLTRHPHVVVGIRNHPARDTGWYTTLRRYALNRHISMTVSNAMSSHRYMIEQEGILPERARFIPNGLELERFSPTQAAERKTLLPEDWRDKVIVGTVGALAERKWPEQFVEVARRVLDQTGSVRFVHAGDGDLREKVQQLSRDLGVDQYMRFLGARRDVPAVLQAFDIFLMTSRNEGTPNAAMEAMATGLPCVLTDIGDCRELIVEGETGFIAPVGDADQLARYVLQLAADPALRQRMGQAGYARIQDYDVHKMAAQYRDLYREILTGSPALLAVE